MVDSVLYIFNISIIVDDVKLLMCKHWHKSSRLTDFGWACGHFGRIGTWHSA